MAGSENTHRIYLDNRTPSALRRAGVALCALGVVVSILAVATPPNARAATPEVLLGRNRIGEFQPARGQNFLAWQQNSRANPGQYDVFGRSIGGGAKFQVNAAGTNGANGDIDGDMLVYQEFTGSSSNGRSDIKFFDLDARDRSSPPDGVNTNQWEYWPSMSGNWLMFGRIYGNGARRLILFNLSSGETRRLDSIRGADAFIAPGEVSGDYAVWHRCTSNNNCNVIRLHIPDGDREQIAKASGSQHSASVTPDGTVYFARSGGRCGTSVRLIQQPLQGEPVVLWRLPGGDDVGTTRTYVDNQGDITLLYDHFACGRAAESDAWEIVEDGSRALSVTVTGNGDGDVRSSPGGINCGPDCAESYPPGTTVTLTADPDGNSSFGGWGDDCSGTNETCVLTMDEAMSVTATFTNRPVLTVDPEGSGQGTVTSNPQGINCGSDCTQAYNMGTQVSLDATAANGSTFAGWGGGVCNGTGACQVTMSMSRTVTATFTTAAVMRTLNVTVTGTGDVDSAPGGINNCVEGGSAADCQESYADGTPVTLTASSITVVWGGDCATAVGDTCNLTMSSNMTATAMFA